MSVTGLNIASTATGWHGRFQAMASPCEVLVEGTNASTARRAIETAALEVRRIERKYSRYRDDNVMHAINASDGRPVEVDDETARLLDYAQQCHQLSNGRFDVTSGVLRRVWTFDGSARVPARADVEAVMAHVGWNRVRWEPPRLTLESGMEIDFGGFGKEYATDRALDQAQAVAPSAAILINLGGDLAVSGERPGRQPWNVGIEAPSGTRDRGRLLQMHHGALATSGDSKRYLLKNGVRYSHVLDPRTGWPPMHAPRSVTVYADSCATAGLLATLAILHGRGAYDFLQQQGVQFWLYSG